MIFLSLEQFLDSSKKNEDISIGLLSGCFDILHEGHIAHIAQAKHHINTGILLVLVTADNYFTKRNKAVLNEISRAIIVNAIKGVEHTIVNNYDSCVKAISEIKPNYYFKGFDYTTGQDKNGKLQQEIEELEKHNGKLVYTSNAMMNSSSKIIQTIKNSIILESESVSVYGNNREPVISGKY